MKKKKITLFKSSSTCPDIKEDNYWNKANSANKGLKKQGGRIMRKDYESICMFKPFFFFFQSMEAAINGIWTDHMPVKSRFLK